MLKAEDNAMVDIKEWRQEFGITQQALAKASGLDVRWIQKVEAGDIDIMNVTLSAFFDNMKGEINAKKTTFCISTNYFMLFIRM